VRTTPEDAPWCYGCSLTENRWLCPFHRRLYTFSANGTMRRRESGELSRFEIKRMNMRPSLSAGTGETVRQDVGRMQQ
jgi:hypothetical protein